MASETRVLIEKTAEYTAKIGDSFLETLKSRYSKEATHKFLFPESPEHAEFLERVKYYKQLQKNSDSTANDTHEYSIVP